MTLHVKDEFDWSASTHDRPSTRRLVCAQPASHARYRTLDKDGVPLLHPPRSAAFLWSPACLGTCASAPTVRTRIITLQGCPLLHSPHQAMRHAGTAALPAAPPALPPISATWLCTHPPCTPALLSLAGSFQEFASSSGAGFTLLVHLYILRLYGSDLLLAVIFAPRQHPTHRLYNLDLSDAHILQISLNTPRPWQCCGASHHYKDFRKAVSSRLCSST